MNRTLLIGILLLVGFAVGISLTWPKYQAFQQVSFELASRQQELENRETYFADLTRIKATLAEFPDQLAKIEAALPQDAELPALYDFLQTSSALSGMSVRNISASLGGRPQGLKMRTIPATLELTGSYGALKELVSRLKTASRMAQVQSLNISGASDPGRFNVTVQLHLYSY